MTHPEKLNCPFCGGTDIRFTNHGKVSRDPHHFKDDVWSTCCYDCGATFPSMYSKEHLVEKWQRRPMTHPDQERIDYLEKFVDVSEDGDFAYARLVLRSDKFPYLREKPPTVREMVDKLMKDNGTPES